MLPSVSHTNPSKHINLRPKLLLGFSWTSQVKNVSFFNTKYFKEVDNEFKHFTEQN